MPELGFVGFRLGFANPRFELRQLMGVTHTPSPGIPYHVPAWAARHLRHRGGALGNMD